MRVDASKAADEAFPAERLAAQQSQILRRLEQIDEPARVIAFPAATWARLPRSPRARRVAPAWVGVAAAAGLVIGVDRWPDGGSARSRCRRGPRGATTAGAGRSARCRRGGRRGAARRRSSTGTLTGARRSTSAGSTTSRRTSFQGRYTIVPLR